MDASVMLAWGLKFLIITLIAIFAAYFPVVEHLPRVIGILIYPWPYLPVPRRITSGDKSLLANAQNTRWPMTPKAVEAMKEDWAAGEQDLGTIKRKSCSKRSFQLYKKLRRMWRKSWIKTRSNFKPCNFSSTTRTSPSQKKSRVIWKVANLRRCNERDTLDQIMVDGAQEQICRKYKILEQIEKDICATEKVIETAKEEAAAVKGMDEKTDSYPWRKKESGSNEKAEDTCQHAELKAVFEKACADYKYEYSHANDSEPLWRAAHAASIKVDNHAH